MARALCVLLFAFAASGAEVTRVGRWELHNSFWMNLHQTLMREASPIGGADLAALPAEQRSAWASAVAAYREQRGPGSITFAEPMMFLQNELTQVADDSVDPPLTSPLAAAIRQAAPVYRTHWWPRDEAANRFLIGYLGAMLRDAGEELVRAHEAVYGAPFPATLRLDITAWAEPFGAYSHPLRHGFVITIASRDPGSHGLTALELALHESSHSVVSPFFGSVAGAIAAASKTNGIEPPRDLWHAILFATTSELTRRALTARGATGYVPLAADLLTRAWPQYRKPIETFWLPYLSGSGTLEDAIAKVVAAVREGR